MRTIKRTTKFKKDFKREAKEKTENEIKHRAGLPIGKTRQDAFPALEEREGFFIVIKDEPTALTGCCKNGNICHRLINTIFPCSAETLKEAKKERIMAIIIE